MKIYIASRYSTKSEMKYVADILKEQGHIITSHWLNEPHAAGVTMDQIPRSELSLYAQQDLRDIESADVVLFFSCDPLIPTVRGGRHFEAGYAIGKGKPLWVVGPEENIFCTLPQVIIFATLSDVVNRLKEKVKNEKA